MNRVLYFFRRILGFFNIPKHIKRYFIKRKMKKYKVPAKNSGNTFLKLINFAIIVTLMVSIGYLNWAYRDLRIQIASASILVIILIVLIIKRLRSNRRLTGGNQEIRELILKDENDKIIKRWYINNSTSLLIGKKTHTNQVDIDLSEAVYASLISREHAVMNNTGDKWYFEDVGSSNGSGIKRKFDGSKFKVEIAKPYRINPGDTIYLANTKLFVQ